MQNLGYMQLKANPGVWKFGIKKGSEGSEEYSLLDSFEVFKRVRDLNLSQAKAKKFVQLPVLDLSGSVIYPVFNKIETAQERKELDSLYERSSSFGGFFKGLLSSPNTPRKSKQAAINIFTLASGHLYERFLGIMTASVRAHTSETVKFWLLENYMSPKLKRELPILADHYKFEYELITYKWPAWLTSQREKQRTIWGYKILFLDVLFPQDLEKVIFVDSDQIIRTDLKELVDLDLEGAPYGYTPMCDSRTEMEGFRFWKTGYWKRTLYDQGLKYHISALYVVDLNKFRSIKAGDKLRQHYQGLSQDPESLSNLDQDLPNDLQTVIKIHSLPQEWLWCETWCSDEALKTARTIDLCNNPLTKEPKLVRARRQILEWVKYDSEIASLLEEDPVQIDEPAKIPVEETVSVNEQKLNEEDEYDVVDQDQDEQIDVEEKSIDEHDEL
ncbi:unnamed protein product [Ambrosiozyma monospora]|uniref:Unnamed protein product n=1 Tax=Ambrosiozyma monospora TaxID=43982 RepID=A0ACB5SSU0_AMBMO|nr:unnamed protein product [Ambrosiozyma monospora]